MKLASRSNNTYHVAAHKTEAKGQQNCWTEAVLVMRIFLDYLKVGKDN